MADQPIEPHVRETMQDIGKMTGEAVKPDGFVLLTFGFEGAGRMNYISNAKREDMIVALKELIANFEGRGPDSGSERGGHA